jgi:hypothetical protein
MDIGEIRIREDKPQYFERSVPDLLETELADTF